ncbi:hypothetical protein ACFL6K_03190 [Candidatus Latescibacterota bacterium]
MLKLVFEFPYFLSCILIYYVIGSYYKLKYGFLLLFLSIILYVIAFPLQSILLRIMIQAIPFAVIFYRTKTGNMTIPDDVYICPSCGHHNEKEQTICGAPRCEQTLTNLAQHSELSYYFPPYLILLIFLAVLLAIMLLD